MATPIRHASKSIILVWILNFFIPGLGNVYATGLSALRYLVVGILIRLFVSHPGVVLGASVLASLIATGEIIAVAEPKPSKKPGEQPRGYIRTRPHAINAPPESILSTLKVPHEQSPQEIIDEYAHKHPELQEEPQVKPVANAYEPASNVNYDDIHAGELTYNVLAGSPNTLEIPEPKYEFPELQFDSLNYQKIGTPTIIENVAFNCPHCGTSGQNDFSFCLSCGHAYAIG